MRIVSFEKEVLVRARNRYEQRVDAHHQLQRHRQEEIYGRYPRVQEIDRELRGNMAKVMAYAFRHGEDPATAVQKLRSQSLTLQQERRSILLKAGYTEEDLAEGPMCRSCSDTGYVGATMCDCLRELCLEEQRKELTSLLTVRSHSFSDFRTEIYPDQIDSAWGISPRQQMELVYRTCYTYAQAFTPEAKSLLMNGGTGLGKTFLSACIAHAVVEKGYSVVYDTAIHVFTCLENEKFGRATEEEARVNRRIMECDLLILDDLGTEMVTAFVSPALYSIINGRLLAGRPTIISTNFTLGELSKRYTPQIASRLMGEYINLGFLGNDIRLRGK